MRSLYLLFATLMFFFFAGTAQAATSTTARALSFDAPVATMTATAATPADDQLFAAAPVDDAALSASHGAGLSRGFVRSASASYAASTFQQVGSVNRIAMDNWFNDVAAPLVLSNMARPVAMV